MNNKAYKLNNEILILKSIVKDQDQKIADLEAKLAESEEKYNATNRAYWELVEKQDNDFLQYEKLIGENQQLKQQLKYLENDHNKLIEQYDNQYNDLCKEIKVHSSARERFVKKVEELKQQVAEKDEEIEDVKAVLFAQKLDKEYAQILAIQNCEQDKISFCIEQLEKVKEHLETEIGSVESFLDPIEYEDYHELLGVCRGYKNSIEEIDNQIKQLKGVK